jgi:hypothetical protein
MAQVATGFGTSRKALRKLHVTWTIGEVGGELAKRQTTFSISIPIFMLRVIALTSYARLALTSTFCFVHHHIRQACIVSVSSRFSRLMFSSDYHHNA